MISEELPPFSSPSQAFLAVLARRQDQTNALLAAQNELLAQIRDRLPAPVTVDVQGPGTVSLREPAPAEAAARPKPAARPKATRRRNTTTSKET